VSFKWLVIDTYYPAFLRTFYANHLGLEHKSYQEQWRALMDECFGTADFYSMNLKKLGHEAEEVIGNCEPLQRQWAHENGVRLGRLLSISDMLRQRKRWLFKVLAAQIEKLKPDILYVQDLNWVDSSFLQEIRPKVRLIIGQTAYPLNPGIDWGSYDLILTSFPHYMEMFRNLGVPCEYLRIAFEPAVLERLGPVQPAYEVAFIGSYSTRHYSRIQILEYVAKNISVDFWGHGVEFLPKNSPIRKYYHGEAWGLDMYRLLAQSKIALNAHIDIAGRFANNMRLFEATGVGACLVTDMKDNLRELFELDKEIVAYRSAEECVELIKYYLNHEDERAAIAKAGQQRTLKEHTYYHRMQELVGIVEHHLRHPESTTRKVIISAVALKQRHLDKIFTALRPLLIRLPGQRFLRLLYYRWSSWNQKISYGHRIIPASAVTRVLTEGWKDPSIPRRQRRLVNSELQRMYRGDVVQVYQVAAEALSATGMIDGFIVEVGCASGYYYEVLSHLLQREIRYVGVDYSPSLVAQACQFYPQIPFLVGDTTALPFANQSCDILFSGTVLLHVPKYERAIRESARVTRHWCIFHRTPVVRAARTTFLCKFAYGVKVVELVFNEEELLSLFQKYGLNVHVTLVVDSYHLECLGEKVTVKTYVCRKE
jgi:SAM-dependent methyltransferase